MKVAKIPHQGARSFVAPPALQNRDGQNQLFTTFEGSGMPWIAALARELRRWTLARKRAER
jgi:hypothetical protein